jgi:hypothetical protein
MGDYYPVEVNVQAVDWWTAASRGTKEYFRRFKGKKSPDKITIQIVRADQ